MAPGFRINPAPPGGLRLLALSPPLPPKRQPVLGDEEICGSCVRVLLWPGGLVRVTGTQWHCPCPRCLPGARGQSRLARGFTEDGVISPASVCRDLPSNSSPRHASGTNGSRGCVNFTPKRSGFNPAPHQHPCPAASRFGVKQALRLCILV